MKTLALCGLKAFSPRRRRSLIQLCLTAALIAGAIFSAQPANAQQNIRARSDFDGDGRTDFALFRPEEGNWYVQGNMLTDFIIIRNWGVSTDVPVPGDYDNDGITDLAVWRPQEGNWYVLNSSTNTLTLRNWGLASLGDVPVPADYDGDGKTDFAIWRQPEGNWYIINSSTDSVTTVGWGQAGDKPVQTDYDGDGRADIAFWRPTDGTWHILNSSFGAQGSTAPQVTVRQWGANGDTVVPEDYDGDFKADVAVWRPSDGNWYILGSKTGTVTVRGWGAGSLGDIPVPADYDDDFKADLAVFRPNEGNWYYIPSGSGNAQNGDRAFIQQWGVAGDVPIPSAYFHE